MAAGAIGLSLLAVVLVAPRAGEIWRAIVRRGDVERNPIVHASDRSWQLAFVSGPWRRARVPLFEEIPRDFPSRAHAPLSNVSVAAEVVRGMGEARVYVLTAPLDRSGHTAELEERTANTMDGRFEDWTPLGPVPVAGLAGPRAVHETGTLRGDRVEVLCALYPDAPRLHLVVAAARVEHFTRLSSELVGILESFRAGAGDAPRPAR